MENTTLDTIAVDKTVKHTSVTVGIVAVLLVKEYRSTGPMPRIPSTSWNPLDLVATPMDCALIVAAPSLTSVSGRNVKIQYLLNPDENLTFNA